MLSINKKIKFFYKKVLTRGGKCVNIDELRRTAEVEEKFLKKVLKKT